MNEKIIVYVDKTYVKITGMKIKGLKPYELESRLEEKLKRRVRIIGVTGEEIDMDIYGLAPEYVHKNSEEIIETISLTEGIFADDVIFIEKAESIIEVDYENLPEKNDIMCGRERWLKFGK